jgi:hypothetical protein
LPLIRRKLCGLGVKLSAVAIDLLLESLDELFLLLALGIEL